MEIIEGTNLKKQKIIDEAEEKGKDPTPEKIKELESESILKMQELAKIKEKSSIGNAKLATEGAPNVPI